MDPDLIGLNTPRIEIVQPNWTPVHVQVFVNNDLWIFIVSLEPVF